MLTINEVAELLGVSPITVRRHVVNGTIRSVRYGRMYRIEPREVARIKREGYREKVN